MGFEYRGSNGPYYYRKVRTGNKVRSEYIGGGSISSICAALDHDHQQERNFRRSAELDWQQSLRSQELANYYVEVTAWLDSQMAQLGFVRHKRGEWRKVTGTTIVNDLRAPLSLIEACTRLAALKRFGIEGESMKGKQILEELERRVESLLRDGNSPIEQILAERIAIAEAHVHYLQNAMFCTDSWNQRKVIDRELNSASNRLLQAVRSLASIRRLPPLTLIQVNPAPRGH